MNLKSKIIQMQVGSLCDRHDNYAIMVLCEDGSIWGKEYYHDLEWINISPQVKDKNELPKEE